MIIYGVTTIVSIMHINFTYSSGLVIVVISLICADVVFRAVWLATVPVVRAC